MSVGYRRGAKSIMRGTFLFFSVAVWAFAIACAGPLKYQVRGQKDPGADLLVVADVNASTSMTGLTLTAQNLAPPDRIDAAATTYVVWARRSAEHAWTRIGTLEYDVEGRTGKLTATTPEVVFDLIVTAEKMGTVASPSPEALFVQHVARQ